MKKTLLPLLAALSLAACGGGGDGPAKAAPVMSIQYYGAPMPQASGGATAKAAVAAAASDAGASETVTTLTQALAAQGVTAAVTPVTMSATALHDLVMSVNGGVRPTNDQLTVKPTGYAVVNFQLDDMVTSRDDPKQVAALEQFQSDLTTFIFQQDLAAKQTFILTPIPTCDQPPGHAASDGLIQAENNATATAFAYVVGTVDRGIVTDANGVTTDPYLIAHMGADCRTPDSTIVDVWTNSAASRMAVNFKAGLDGLQ
ncbi:hypothetical protein [Caballeronia sp. DA-9]|uniref:hypothetical protein n=1 Tax=Caballeronia sp. DA-9 TaxID=3436237 RepID=UPI003F663FDB